ncbi:hypothetical protein [Candidatus Infernicultor aquiphilus]
MDLKKIISQGESENLEFKKPFLLFANTKGTYFNYTQKLKEPKG